MKKALSLILTAAIGVSCIAACSKEPAESETSASEQTTVEETEATTAQTAETAETTAAETTETTAETTAAPAAASTDVTPELGELFDQALDGFVGVGYTPEFYLGNFDDNGSTVHCFLCESTVVTADPVSYWSFVFVTDDGAGNVGIGKVCQPDYACIDVYDGDFLATEVQTEPVPGGWEDTMNFEVTDDRFAEFRLANSIYMPVAILATQVVAGMNYIYLATDADGNFRIVKIYVDLDGGACTSGSKSLNIESLY